jgi:hypothetical protein
MRRPLLLAFWALAWNAAACGPDEVVLPDTPRVDQVNAVAAVYENPTGTIDTAHIQETLAAVSARLTELHLDWLPNLISESLQRLDRRLEDGDLPTDPAAAVDSDHPIIDAVADAQRICRGWSDPAGAPDAAANGTLELTTVVENGRLRPDVWGTATSCKTRLDPLDNAGAIGIMPTPSVNLFVDGSLNIRLYGPLPRSVGEAKFLFLLTGRLDPDRTTDSEIDFRVLEGQLAFRFAVSDGDVIVEIGLTTLSLRGSNGTFVCDLTTLSCQ